MALKQPRPVPFWRAVHLCFLAIFSPRRFDKYEQPDLIDLETRPNATERYRVTKVQRAFLHSLGLVLASGVVGLVLGTIACHYIGKSDLGVATLQTVGAALVLWATLAVRGWDIETFAGVTLTERVNQWIYRSLSCLGTAILVMTVPWASCS
jgi:hypothetical protein